MYDRARGEYRYQMNVFQREIIDVEKLTLMAWLEGVILLSKPPCFVTKTHVGTE